MSIIRAPRPEGNFYLLNKSISEDQRLSWGARGMLVFLLGKPDHWEVSTHHLISQTKDCHGKAAGRDAVRGLIRELEQAGYLQISLMRTEGGEFGGRSYTVSETPATDYPCPVQPSPANPPLVSNESKQVLKKPVSTENPSGSGKAKSQKFDPLTAKPANVSEEAWADWCQHRKEIRKPLTAKTCEQQAKALANHPDPNRVLETSISNGWTGIFPEKVMPGAGGKPSAFNNLPIHTEGMYQGDGNGPAF